MTDDLIERTARGIAGEDFADEWRRWAFDARAAIAIIAPAVLDMALGALKTAQYDPAPYARGKSAILALKAQFQTETQV